MISTPERKSSPKSTSENFIIEKCEEENPQLKQGGGPTGIPHHLLANPNNPVFTSSLTRPLPKPAGQGRKPKAKRPTKPPERESRRLKNLSPD